MRAMFYTLSGFVILFLIQMTVSVKQFLSAEAQRLYLFEPFGESQHKFYSRADGEGAIQLAIKI